MCVCVCDCANLMCAYSVGGKMTHVHIRLILLLLLLLSFTFRIRLMFSTSATTWRHCTIHILRITQKKRKKTTKKNFPAVRPNVRCMRCSLSISVFVLSSVSDKHIDRVFDQQKRKKILLFFSSSS